MIFGRNKNAGQNDNFSRTPGAQDLPRPQLGNFKQPDGYSSVNLGMNFGGHNDFAPSAPLKSGGVQQNLLPDSHRHKSGVSKIARRVGAIIIIVVLLIAAIVLSQSAFSQQ